MVCRLETKTSITLEDSLFILRDSGWICVNLGWVRYDDIERLGMIIYVLLCGELRGMNFWHKKMVDSSTEYIENKFLSVNFVVRYWNLRREFFFEMESSKI